MTTSRLEIDHLFVFVEPDFVDSADFAALRRFGLKLDFGRVHHGQGSANRLALFPEQSLEFLWLAEREAAEHNPLRLDRRADWRARGGDPFGVCLRGRLDPGLRERWFWPYALPGSAPDPIWIARLSDDPRWPMLFVFDTELDTRPRALGYPPALFEHEGGQTKIREATLTCSADFVGLLEPLAAILPSELRFRAGLEPQLELVIEGHRVDTLEIGPLTLTSVIAGSTTHEG